jgi:hypothetical protein
MMKPRNASCREEGRTHPESIKDQERRDGLLQHSPGLQHNGWQLWPHVGSYKSYSSGTFYMGGSEKMVVTNSLKIQDLNTNSNYKIMAHLTSHTTQLGQLHSSVDIKHHVWCFLHWQNIG